MTYRLTAATFMIFAAITVQAAEITVSAAASLKGAFTEIATQYQKKYPDATVKLNTAASGVLLQQISQGAPADILATADEATMDKAVSQNLVVINTRQTFVKNALVLITPKDSKIKLGSLKDLLQATVKHIAIGKPESVPAGAYAKSTLEKFNLFNILQPKFVYTQNVTQALDYVTRGEADAGFVYRTDAYSQKDKLNITATVPTEKPVSYPLAIVAQSKEQAEAKRFVQYVLSANGQAVLKKYGFVKP